MKTIFYFTLFFLVSCSKDNQEKYPIKISYQIDDKEVQLNDNFIISVVREKDTFNFYPKQKKVSLYKFDEFDKYEVNFIYDKKILNFKDVSNKMLNPSQQMEWKFGIENKPFKIEDGLLSTEEFSDETIKQVEYMQFNPLEFGDGIEKVNIIRE